ncbi:flavodoxin [Arcicella rosea]|uniref:Flavodoxin n=1 Tax=Arcicella rosea TaxID=502909 RepID=A0A841EHS5_9BACT|nr:flavodoxin [Arcicella rosea]MBB6002715.1 flavodoxin I [Arcicella rosea]
MRNNSNRIALIYDSETGNTERIAYLIKDNMTDYQVDVFSARDISIAHFAEYDFFILGTPTWRKGYLAVHWADFFDDFSRIDFKGKTIALFGVGDQECFNRTFLDGMGQLAGVVVSNHANLIGKWPTEGYYHDFSLADNGDGYFMGLGLDESNQAEQTEVRVIGWTKQISSELQAQALL